jgi:hypothetical protein
MWRCSKTLLLRRKGERESSVMYYLNLDKLEDMFVPARAMDMRIE